MNLIGHYGLGITKPSIVGLFELYKGVYCRLLFDLVGSDWLGYILI